MTRHQAVRSLALKLLFINSVAAFPSVLLAQSAPTSTPSASDSGGLVEVVVTAQRRAESEVNVPISITAVSGATLHDAGITDMSALTELVPTLRIDYSGSFAQPTIRGVGSALLGPGLAPNVATYVDGIIRPSGLTQDVYFMDVDSIEVLEGPQGTLFGRNATGGAILVNTQAPSFTPSLSGRVAYESYHTVDAALAGTTGITDTLAVSFAAFNTRSDGFVTNLVTDSDAAQYDNYGVRGKVLWRPSDSVQFTLSYEHVHTDDLRAVALGAYNGWSDGVLLGGAAPDYRGTVALDFPSVSTSKYDETNLKGVIDLGWATLTSLTGGQWENDFQSTDNDASSAPLVGVDWAIKDRTISQEFDLTSAKNDSLNWVGGLYYYDNTSEWPALYVSVGGAPQFEVFGGQLKTETYAAFFDVTKTLAQNWFLTLGVRDGSDHAYEYLAFAGTAPKTASKDWNNVTPRAVLRYQIDPDSNVYASFTRGYKSGVFNIPGDSTTPVDPEKISAFEVGYKIAHRSWKLDAAACYYDYKDLQITTYTALGSVLVNASNSQIYGLDLSGEFQLTDHLTAFAAGTYLHARYKDFPNAPDYTWDPMTGVKIGAIDASGFQMERAPENSGNIGLRYSQSLWSGGAALSAWYSYTSRVYFDPADVTSQKSYGLLNARAQWTAPSGKWDVALFGRNLTNVRYINQVLPNTAYFGETWGEPAVFGAEFGFKF
jgi:iron complex outermembrane recepter protein